MGLFCLYAAVVSCRFRISSMASRGSAAVCGCHFCEKGDERGPVSWGLGGVIFNITCWVDAAGAGNAGHVESLRAVMVYVVADALEAKVAAHVVWSVELSVVNKATLQRGDRAM